MGGGWFLHPQVSVLKREEECRLRHFVRFKKKKKVRRCGGVIEWGRSFHHVGGWDTKFGPVTGIPERHAYFKTTMQCTHCRRIEKKRGKGGGEKKVGGLKTLERS